MVDLNNKNLFTNSLKVKKCSALTTYIYKKIVQDKKIQRLVKYNTYNPLSQNDARSYDGKLISQPETNIDEFSEMIFDIPFDPNIELDKKNMIFVNLRNVNFKYGNVINIDVNVLVPQDYLEINLGKRHFEIAECISNIFDSEYVDVNEESLFQELGAMKFNLDEYTILRLSRTNNFIWVNMMFSTQLTPIARA